MRELEHAVERAVILSEGEWVDAAALPERVRRDEAPRDPNADRALRLHTDCSDPRASDSNSIHEAPSRPRDDKTLAAQVRGSERAALVAALEAAAWNRSRAARALGINRTTLYRKMRDLGLDGGRAAG